MCPPQQAEKEASALCVEQERKWEQWMGRKDAAATVTDRGLDVPRRESADTIRSVVCESSERELEATAANPGSPENKEDQTNLRPHE